MNLTLVRDYSGEDCTLGTLTVNGLALDTLERPWVADPPQLCGHPDTSCVPAGEYQLLLHDTPKFPRHFALYNPALGIYHESVPEGRFGRTACLLHVGNFVSDCEGCTLLGRDRRYIAERWMLTNSADAYRAFSAAVPWVLGHVLTVSYSSGISP